MSTDNRLFQRVQCRKRRRGKIKNKRSLPVGDELQRGSEVFVVVGNPLHQRLPVGYLQLNASLRVVEMGLVVLLTTPTTESTGQPR